MTHDRITVETTVDGPVARACNAYTSPDHVTKWNFASDDWHCPRACADLREGGTFSVRMEAKDGSMGFDFEGTHTRIIENERIEYEFGDRHAVVEFVPMAGKVTVRVTFEPETVFPPDEQRDGWQSILNSYARHVATL